MRFTRILLLVVAAATLSGVFAAGANAIAFNDTPCRPDVVGPTIHYCGTGETGKAYSLQITAHGGCDVYVWSNPGGGLPPGLTLGSAGLISGTPTTAGKYIFWLRIQDTPGVPASWCTDDHASDRQFEIDILQGLQIAQRQSSLTPAQASAPYSLQLTANGANGSTLTWSVASGSLPAGFNLNSSTGLLSGTATSTGDYHFQIKVSDGTRSDVQSYNLTVVRPLKVTSASAAAAEVGQSFETTLTADGGKPAYTWTITNGAKLPDGLTLNASTGAITGTPTSSGEFTLKLTVTDSLGLTQTVDYHLVVAAKLAIVKRALPSAKVGHAYNARLLVIGGVAPKTWTIAGGKLPAGLRLNTRTGVISGTPRHAGKSRITIVVTDKLGVSSTATFSLKVVG